MALQKVIMQWVKIEPSFINWQFPSQSTLLLVQTELMGKVQGSTKSRETLRAKQDLALIEAPCFSLFSSSHPSRQNKSDTQ